MKNRLAGVAFAAAAATLVTASTLAAQAAPAARPPAQTRAPATGAAGTTPGQTAQNVPALTSTAVAGRQSWLSDRRDFHLGDIVTVLVDEYTLTSLDKEVNATDNRQRTLGLGISTPDEQQDFRHQFKQWQSVAEQRTGCQNEPPHHRHERASCRDRSERRDATQGNEGYQGRGEQGKSDAHRLGSRPGRCPGQQCSVVSDGGRRSRLSG